MERITKAQIKILKESIDKMAKSDEQFFFMIFKNKNGTDNVTEYSYNMVPEKMIEYWEQAVNKAKIQEDR